MNSVGLSFGKKKKTKKISSQLKKLCKRLKIRLTVKRGKKRVYKSEKMLKAQCKKASGKKKKKVKRKRRRKFGSERRPEVWSHRRSDAPSPGGLMSPPQRETSPHILQENSSPSGSFSGGRRSVQHIPFSFDQFGKKKRRKKVKRKRKKVKRKRKKVKRKKSKK
jgi:hypothetical protein